MIVYLSADDFGRSPERNRAIDEAFKRGLIKSTGLIVTGRYLLDAIHLMKEGGYVRNVHCHFNLSGNIQGEDSEDAPLTITMQRDNLFCKNGYFRSYAGLPNKPSSIFKFPIVYRELAEQYRKFVDITDGEGNYGHVDFHLWYNLTWPVAIALNLFTWTHRIKSVRYIGVHQEKTKRSLIRLLSWNPFVKCYHSSNIDGFLTNPQKFRTNSAIELYCHPDYIDGQLIDNSNSYHGNEKQTMETNLSLLKRYNLEFASWADEV